MAAVLVVGRRLAGRRLVRVERLVVGRRRAAAVGPGPPSTGDSAAAFCAVFATLPTDTPEAYVGSAEHVADIEELLDVSPPAIRTEVESFRTYVASGDASPRTRPARTR